MNDVSRVDHLSSVKCVTNVPTVAPDLPVGARLHQFWEKWAALGVSPKVVTVLRKCFPSRKQVANKLSGTKDSLSGPKRVPRPQLEQSPWD